MSDAIETNLWKRLRYTPLRDLVRGRVSGRLDYKGRIESSGLSAPVKELILNVVARTRLWSIEKVEVANELVAHFADGLETSTDRELIDSFGNSKTAAKLIRRAVIRNRPLPWHVLRVTRWCVGLFVLYYGICVVLLMSGSPRPSVDYTALLNRDASQHPVEDYAWPIYRQAIINLQLNTNDGDAHKRFYDLTSTTTQRGTPFWNDLIAWLDAQQPHIQLIRNGAAKPVLGFIYGSKGSAQDSELFPWHSTRKPGLLGPETLVDTIAPAINDFREMGYVLVADARVARAQNNSARLIDDLQALLGIARQLQNDRLLLSNLIGIAIRSMATTAVDRTLVYHNSMLSDLQLQHLAHLLAEPRRADQLITLEAERMMFYDLVQRMYTDDGHGDGRLTLQGLRGMQGVMPPTTQPGDKQMATLVNVTSPILAASRKQTVEKYESLLGIVEANLHLPIRQVHWDAYDRALQEFRSSTFSSLRHTLLAYMAGSFNRTQFTAESWLGQRDGVIVAIALEAYRRQHGSYPGSLDALVPEFLPEVPIDRITGNTVIYRLIDGKPVIYSVGADGDDDGGRPPAKRNGQPWEMVYPKEQRPDGDWILYPQPITEDDEQQ